MHEMHGNVEMYVNIMRSLFNVTVIKYSFIICLKRSVLVLVTSCHIYTAWFIIGLCAKREGRTNLLLDWLLSAMSSAWCASRTENWSAPRRSSLMCVRSRARRWWRSVASTLLFHCCAWDKATPCNVITRCRFWWRPDWCRRLALYGGSPQPIRTVFVMALCVSRIDGQHNAYVLTCRCVLLFPMATLVSQTMTAGSTSLLRRSKRVWLKHRQQHHSTDMKTIFQWLWIFLRNNCPVRHLYFLRVPL